MSSIRKRSRETPEDFLNVLGMDTQELSCCTKLGVYTIRQFAESGGGCLPNKEREEALLKRACQIVGTHYSDRNLKLRDTIIWVYIYVGPLMLSSINTSQELKSPFVLFQEYIECPLEARENHAWKSIYNSLSDEVSECTNLKSNAPSDIEVFSYLIWLSAQSALGKLDVTAGPRSIPFFYSWMPSEAHGTSMKVDSVFAKELGIPHLEDRYAYPIAINLTRLCEEYDAKLFKADTFTKEGKVDKSKWHPISLSDVVDKQTSTQNHWDRFNPGEKITDRVPHGCIVMPTGSIPQSCIKVFPRKEPIPQTLILPYR